LLYILLADSVFGYSRFEQRSSIDSKTIESPVLKPFKPHYWVQTKKKLQKRKIEKSEVSCSSEEMMNTVHPNLTAQKILEMYRKGRMGAVSQAMKQNWNSQPHPLI